MVVFSFSTLIFLENGIYFFIFKDRKSLSAAKCIFLLYFLVFISPHDQSKPCRLTAPAPAPTNPPRKLLVQVLKRQGPSAIRSSKPILSPLRQYITHLHSHTKSILTLPLCSQKLACMIWIRSKALAKHANSRSQTTPLQTKSKSLEL